MYILIFGDPINGFTFVGPFDTPELATSFGEPLAEEWHLARLDAPLSVTVNEDDTVIVDPPKCGCGHLWSNHSQNVHGLWVCRECNCRGMVPPRQIVDT